MIATQPLLDRVLPLTPFWKVLHAAAWSVVGIGSSVPLLFVPQDGSYKGSYLEHTVAVSASAAQLPNHIPFFN